ncbi:MAG: response regulator transcription factor [Alphaproteobacteria bacterium]|nr:response regulator transcription factor [Alphaproteobacteria bacterium]
MMADIADDKDQDYRPLVLVVDDDKELRDLLKRYLDKKNFFCHTAALAAAAKELLRQHDFSAVVLDVQMPDQSGMDLLKEWRGAGNNIPIIMLTAMGNVENRVLGLSLGADDYLGKPFEPEELVLRLKKIIGRQRLGLQIKNKVAFGRGSFNRQKKHLFVDGKRVYLTSAEERLFCYLLERSGRAVSREQLNQAGIILGGERTIDVHIARIRKKIGDNGDKPQYLMTIRHKGYEMRLDT